MGSNPETVKEGDLMSFGTTANNQNTPAPASAPAAKGKAPVEKIRVGGIQLDVWENQSEKGTFYSFTIQRSYKQGNDWKNTNSLRTQDLPKAILALQEAYKKAVMAERE